MTLTQFITRVCNRTNKNPSDTTVTARIKGHVNNVGQEKWDGFPWSFRKREHALVLTADVTDTSSNCTLTATNGNRAVTASGTPFVSGTHENCWLRFRNDADLAWYRVLSVNSTSQVTIDPAYQGTTGSLKTFELKKTDYLLPTELSELHEVNVTFLNRDIDIVSKRDLESAGFPPLDARSAPTRAAILNDDFTGSVYSTGTVSGAINTRTLTGSGSTWLGNVSPGDEVVINGDTNTYKVFSVDSNTQITLYNNLVVAASGATYTATRQFGRYLRIYPSPDKAYVLFVTGFRKWANLVNNADVNEFLHRCASALEESCVSLEQGSSPDAREDSAFQKAEIKWQDAQAQDEKLTPRRNVRPIWNLRG